MRVWSLVPLHGIASRGDLPLPFSFVVVGAGAALILTFAVLFLAWPRPRYVGTAGVPLPRLTRLARAAVIRIPARLAVLALYAWIGLALAAGQDRLSNPAIGFIFVWLWVGLVPLSLLAGPLWRATNPVRTAHRGLAAVARVDPNSGLVRLPPALGVWPAAVGLVAFAWLELVQPDRTALAVLRLWAVAWLVILILGAVAFGSGWIEAADPFETYAATVARMSPLQYAAAVPGDAGGLRWTNPVAALARWHPPPGAAAVAVVLLGSTAFDSFANTTGWISTVQSSSRLSTLWATGGLLGMIAIVGLTFGAAAGWMSRYGIERHPARSYPRLLGGSLVPIVVGYAVAHYATLLVVEGQRVLIGLSDPLGRGWNVFGTADRTVDTGLYSHPTAVAVLQVTAILLGHLLGVVVAHERSLTLLRPEGALRGQWPMLGVMVGYTCCGLLLLFSP